MTGPDMQDLRATMALAHPKYARMTDPHDYPQTAAGQPAIRLIDYMGDYDDYYENNLIGPYPDVQTRNADLARLRGLPLGRPEFNGGYEFLPATFIAPKVANRTVAPEQVAGATTISGFFAAFHGYTEDEFFAEVGAGEDLADVHPDQMPIF
jgi:hypothetical protein